MHLNYPHIPNSHLDTEALTMSAFWSLLSPCSDRSVTLASGTDATTPGTRTTSPSWWGGHRQTSPAASGCPRMLYAARSAPEPQLPRPRPLSGWNLNLRRDAAGRVKPWVKHGEFGIRRVLPGATAACSLGTETCLHRSGAAGDRATLPGTTGAGGHVLPADPESQRNTTTTRTPDPVWDLGAHLCRQPRAASLSGRRAVGTGATGLLPPPGALRPICCQRREISDYPSGAAEEE